jgi:hypothetical protein
MTEQAISPLRRRMIEDMSIRKFAAKTQHDYVQRVKDFATFLGRSAATAKAEDVRCFRLHLTAISSLPSNFCCRLVVQFTVTDLPSSCGGNGADSASPGADNAALTRTAQTARETHAHTVFLLFAKTPTIENEARGRNAQRNRMPDNRKTRRADVVDGSARRFCLDVDVDKPRRTGLLG